MQDSQEILREFDAFDGRSQLLGPRFELNVPIDQQIDSGRVQSRNLRKDSNLFGFYRAIDLSV